MNLKELNQGVLVSGRLSEVHIHNLRQYPFLVFNNLDSAEISYNLEPLLDNQDGSYVEFVLKFKNRIPKNIKQSAKILSDMVKVLLWKKIHVEVAYKKNKDLVYVTKQRADS